MATLGKLELKNLRSWTTVGTPYLRHKMPSTMRLTNILRICVGLVLLKPVYTTATKFFDLLFRPHQSVWLSLWSPDDEAINGLRATAV